MDGKLNPYREWKQFHISMWVLLRLLRLYYYMLYYHVDKRLNACVCMRTNVRMQKIKKNANSAWIPSFELKKKFPKIYYDILREWRVRQTVKTRKRDGDGEWKMEIEMRVQKSVSDGGSRNSTSITNSSSSSLCCCLDGDMCNWMQAAITLEWESIISMIIAYNFRSIS